MIFGGSLDHWNTHNIDTSNTVNGKPVYYYKNQSGIVVPADAGQVILANCTHFVIENQNLSYASVGIQIGFSSSIIIRNNNCSNNYNYGIYLSSSSSNSISNNNCSNNWCGIGLDSSSSNSISNNTCCSNNWYGIYLYSSSSNSISNNTISDNTGYGIQIYSGSNFNRIWNNSFYNNNGATSVYDPSHIQACDDGTGNLWNTSGTPHGFGNYWGDWTSPDANMDGIVDNPYVIDGSADAKDYYPLTQFPYIPGSSPYIPDSSMLILIAFILLAIAFTLLAVILIRRGRKER
jgi:parallel beta-helix repeat protein